jgi:hypothetical protein
MQDWAEDERLLLAERATLEARFAEMKQQRERVEAYDRWIADYNQRVRTHQARKPLMPKIRFSDGVTFGYRGAATDHQGVGHGMLVPVADWLEGNGLLGNVGDRRLKKGWSDAEACRKAIVTGHGQKRAS